MFKQLIKWIYERFGTKPLDQNKAMFDFAKRASNEFAQAGYDDQPKPPYPEYNGKAISSVAKEILDERYYDASALYESSKHWVGK